jgi:alpha-glucosidase
LRFPQTPVTAATTRADARGLSWWQDGILYQIYPRSFQDLNGDGVGDLLGIIGRLPYLRDLGVEAIWLSPIFPSPMADFGYDISNYLGIDPIFGTLNDFDTLVAAAHASNLKVILDLVPNHTSNQHPWFIESRSAIRVLKRPWVNLIENSILPPREPPRVGAGRGGGDGCLRKTQPRPSTRTR